MASLWATTNSINWERLLPQGKRKWVAPTSLFMPAIPAGAHIQTNVCATRDAILEALKQLSEVESAMSALMAIYEVRLEQSGKSIAIEERAIAFREVYREAFRSFCKAKNVVNMVCGPDVQNRFAETQITMYRLTEQAANEKMQVDEWSALWGENLLRLYAAIRAQLGIEISPQPTFMPQSSGSSAAQVPDPQGPAKA
jgi:hypothetical protein